MEGYLRIGGAFTLAILVIAGALYMRSLQQEAVGQGTLAAVSAPERQYIEMPDSDGDGIRDWEEELIKNTITELSAITGTGTEEVDVEPDTYTEQFARSFFEGFIRQETNTALPKTEEQFVSEAIKTIEQATQQKVHTKADIAEIPDSDLAVREYGNETARILNSYTVKNENEAAIFARALEAKDTEILKELDPIREAYEGMIRDTLSVATPNVLAEEHLALLNAYQAILTDVTAMQSAFTDPLLALARIKRYEEDTQGLTLALLNIHITLRDQGIIYADDEAGSFFRIFDI